MKTFNLFYPQLPIGQCNHGEKIVAFYLFYSLKNVFFDGLQIYTFSNYHQRVAAEVF